MHYKEKRQQLSWYSTLLNHPGQFAITKSGLLVSKDMVVMPSGVYISSKSRLAGRIKVNRRILGLQGLQELSDLIKFTPSIQCSRHNG